MRIRDWSSDVCSSDLPSAKPDACARTGEIQQPQPANRAHPGGILGILADSENRCHPRRSEIVKPETDPKLCLTAGAAKAPDNAEGCIPLPSFRLSAEKWSDRIHPRSEEHQTELKSLM